MEQKDPHFNIHDYVDLSQVEGTPKGEILLNELIQLAKDPDLASQSYLAKAVQTQGQRLIFTADDNIPSQYFNGVININFRSLETLYFETSPELIGLTYENYDEFDKNYTPKHDRRTLPGTIWHEIGHVIDLKSESEMQDFYNDLLAFKQEFDSYISTTNIPEKTKATILSLNPYELTGVLLFAKSDDIDITINPVLNALARKDPEPRSFQDKLALLNGRHNEAAVIEATNEGFFRPKGLPSRILHLNIHTKTSEPQPIITIEDLGTKEFSVELFDGSQCLNCQEVNPLDLQSPNLDKSFKQSVASTERE